MPQYIEGMYPLEQSKYYLIRDASQTQEKEDEQAQVELPLVWLQLDLQTTVKLLWAIEKLGTTFEFFRQ